MFVFLAKSPERFHAVYDPDGLNLDLKLVYDFNRRNPSTDYRSGQEAHADYAVGWAMAG